MSLFNKIFMLSALIAVGAIVSARAENSPTFMSPYGQIQNVQNYSSNPFWTQNGGYRQNMPVPVYVTGPDVTTADCTTAVSALIAAYCGANNNCQGQTLADVRPAIILQLSRLPGHNYATSCIGYIDSEYEKYSKNQNVINKATAFPTGVAVPNPNVNGNSYKIQLPRQKVPEWQAEMMDRQQELKSLQDENGGATVDIVHTDFPKTYQDLSFSDRMAIEGADYAIWKDKNPYHPIALDDESFKPKAKKEENKDDNKKEETPAINQALFNKIKSALIQAKNQIN